MARSEDIDPNVRERIAKWLEYLKYTRGETNEQLAAHLKLKEPTITNILNRQRSAGLDVFVKIVQRGGIRADEVIAKDPPDLDELREAYYVNRRPPPATPKKPHRQPGRSGGR